MTSLRSVPIRLAVFAGWLIAVFALTWLIGSSLGTGLQTVERSHASDIAAHTGGDHK